MASFQETPISRSGRRLRRSITTNTARLFLPVVALIPAAACSGESPYREQALSAPTLPDAVFFVVDTSASMSDDVLALSGNFEPKIDIAQRSLIELRSALPDSIDTGLLSYPGSRARFECSEGQVEVELGAGSEGSFRNAVTGLDPSGDTPTAEALTYVSDLIRRENGPVTVVLISDGMSSCGDPCEAADDLDRDTDWDLVVIGFDLGDTRELECMADVTGGTYINVDDGAALEELFRDPTNLFSVTS